MIGYVFFAFSLTPSCVITSRLIYGAANGNVSFFHQLIFHLYRQQFFFVHPSVGGLFGYFHILAVVILCNVDMFACVLPFLSSQFIGPGIGLLDHMVAKCLLLKAPLFCSPQWLYQFTFPPTVQEGSLFSTPSPPFVVCRFSDAAHSNWCEVVPHCTFDLHFSNNQ